MNTVLMRLASGVPSEFSTPRTAATKPCMNW